MSSQVVRFLQQESARLQKENQALQNQVQSLHSYVDILVELHLVARQMADAEKPLDLLSQCIYDTMKAIGASDGSMSYLDPSTDELVFVVVRGMLQKMLTGRRMKSDVGVMGWVMENGRPIVVNEPRQDWRFSREIDDEFSFLTRSIMCAPVMREGKPIGVVELLNKEPQKFSETDATVLSVLCDIAAVALEKMGS
jgi:two-component system phosphate regulon sensor histidine kinase PhoR